MDFSNERYVRLYVRDTVTWKRLGWDGQNALTQLLRKADRSGVIDLGGIEPWEALVVLCGAPEDQARRGVERVLSLGCLEHDGDRLVFPRYLEANECAQSDAQRQRESRARRAVTKRDGSQSQNVTECHGQSQDVTDGHSVPCRAVPYQEELRKPPHAGARDVDPVEVGGDFMTGLFNRHFHPSEWRSQLERIGLKPASERAKVSASIQADAYCRANPTHVKPSFVLRQWDDHLAGNPPPKPVARSSSARFAGPSRVATAAEFEADKTEKAPWET